MIELLTAAALLGAAAGPVDEAAPGPPSAETAPAQPDPVRVVATLPVYADVVRQIGGDQVEVSSIAGPNEDAHFVRPKPSFALDLRRADLFITTGLDLELWVPALLDRAGNARVSEGGEGYVTAYTGIELLQVPETVDRSGGDIHIYGNPHLHTDPLRVLQVARNITQGLKNVAPDRSDRWDRGLRGFREEIHRRLYGADLVEILGGPALEELSRSGNLLSFLRGNEYQGEPLIERLGGWLAAAEPFRDRELICYHKNWAYFQDRFGVNCAAYVEGKPGIPPTPGHVRDLVGMIQERNIPVVLAASYFDRSKVERVAERSGARAVIVPLYPGSGELDTYFAVVDRWVNDLAQAFRETSTE